jgi:hypothetical protein
MQDAGHEAGLDAGRETGRDAGPGGVGAPAASWRERNRHLVVAGGYVAVAAALAIVGRAVGSIAMLNVLVLMAEPMMSLSLSTIGPWPATIFGVLVNAAALGLLLSALRRFSTRMDNMSDLALRVLGRNR